MTNPQAQTLLDAAARRKRLAPPRLRNWELSNCGFIQSYARRAGSEPPDVGHVEDFRTRSRRRRSVRYYHLRG